MIHPSYSEVMEAINSDTGADDETPLVTSRYSVVLAASKRARQIIGGDKALVPDKGKKPLSVAVEELYKGKVKILPEEQEEE
jgi:DNA-directed RNA polymerase subunit omega